jgi:hypothetical protein
MDLSIAHLKVWSMIVMLSSAGWHCTITMHAAYTVQFWMIWLSHIMVGTWRVEIWYMSRVMMATWWKVKNVTICLGFLPRDRMSSSSKFCPGLLKFWSCHGPLGELPKWKFWQACHGHRGVTNHLKLYSKCLSRIPSTWMKTVTQQLDSAVFPRVSVHCS